MRKIPGAYAYLILMFAIVGVCVVISFMLFDPRFPFLIYSLLTVECGLICLAVAIALRWWKRITSLD